MKLPSSAHTSRPWRIHELASDFRLEDVWALPTPGGPRDFHRLVERFASTDPSSGSLPGRALWAVRRKLGELLGWDGPQLHAASRELQLQQPPAAHPDPGGDGLFAEFRGL